MTSMRGNDMRTRAGLAAALLCATLGDVPVASAQVSEASQALNAAVGQAKRLLRGSYASRRQNRRLRRASKPVPVAPAPLPERKPDRRKAKVLQKDNSAAAAAVVAKPDVWTKDEIAKAVRGCKKILEKVKAEFAPTDPVKKGPCGSPAPYRLASLGGRDSKVVLTPPATLNCKMIAALDRWVRRDLQRLAKKHLGSPITGVSVMSSYSCRNAYGRTSTRLSEHAKANALDIGGFVTADGKATKLLAHWGPTKRDLDAEARRLAAAKDTDEPKRESKNLDGKPHKLGRGADEKQERATSRIAKSGVGDAAEPQLKRSKQNTSKSGSGKSIVGQDDSASSDSIPALPERRPSLRKRLLWAKAERNRNVAEETRKSRDAYRRNLRRFLAPRSNLGGPKTQRQQGAAPAKNEAKSKIDRAAFLRGAHSSACRIFGTVLGPEANDAHRNHFHVDLAFRRRSNYCR